MSRFKLLDENNNWIPLANLSDLREHENNSLAHKNLFDSKQDVISDLSTIRSQAAGAVRFDIEQTLTDIEKKRVKDSLEVLPSQTGHSGEFLTTNGTNASWSSVITYKEV